MVDRLTKSDHFLPICEKDHVGNLVNIYIQEKVRLHGVPLSIASNWDSRYSLKVWMALQEAFGTQLDFSSTFHPQTDG